MRKIAACLFHSFEEIKIATNRSQALIDKLLSFSRESNTSNEVVNIYDIINESKELLSNFLPKDISIDVTSPISEIYINVDGTHLQQVFINLCINSRDAMPSGGEIKIICAKICSANNKTFFQEHDLIGKSYAYVIFQDTGIGIKDKVIKSIFDPFFTTKEKGKGTGLGLSSVKNIIESVCNGHIFVTSIYEIGTTFHILIPTYDEINN